MQVVSLDRVFQFLPFPMELVEPIDLHSHRNQEDESAVKPGEVGHPTDVDEPGRQQFQERDEHEDAYDAGQESPPDPGQDGRIVLQQGHQAVHRFGLLRITVGTR